MYAEIHKASLSWKSFEIASASLNGVILLICDWIQGKSPEGIVVFKLFLLVLQSNRVTTSKEKGNAHRFLKMSTIVYRPAPLSGEQFLTSRRLLLRNTAIALPSLIPIDNLLLKLLTKRCGFELDLLEQSILDFAEGLRVCGICPGEHMSLFAENSHRWLIADQGIMAAVRGSRSSADELYHIFTHSDSVALVVDNLELYNKIAARLKRSTAIKFVIVLWGSKESLGTYKDESKVPFYSFDDLMTSGRTSRQALAAVASSGERVQYDVIRRDDVATLVYTSGTTSNPKAVMLTHANLLH